MEIFQVFVKVVCCCCMLERVNGKQVVTCDIYFFQDPNDKGSKKKKDHDAVNDETSANDVIQQLLELSAAGNPQSSTQQVCSLFTHLVYSA